MNEDGIGAVAATAFGALLLLTGLFLPLFTVHYTPPGGSGIVNGHPVAAFSETVSGWRFAATARWTAPLYVLGLVVLPLATLVLYKLGLGAARFVTHPVMAFLGIVVAAGWLAYLGLELLPKNLVMPTGGEDEILASFHTDPLSSGYQQTMQALGLNNPPTPDLAASFGVGWFVLAAAILIGLVALWRWVAYIAVILIAVLLILRFTDHSLFNSATAYLLAASTG